MKQKLTYIFLMGCLGYSTMAQKFTSPVKPSIIGFHYGVVDYTSPTEIKNTSLSDVFKKGDIFDPTKQSSVLSLSYWKGLTRLLDFSGRINGIFYDYARHNSGQIYNNEFGGE